MGEKALKSHMGGKKHVTNSKPICFFQAKPVPFLQAVETGTDDCPSASSGQTLAGKRKAEKMWVLKCVVCEWSVNSTKKIFDLFKVMFSDSQIASEFQMNCIKLSYLINIGIALHFRQLLVDEINCCSFFTMCFDESLNKVTQTSQIDLVVRFWNTTKNQVSVQYWDSKFLGHTRADDILVKFNSSMSNVGPNKMIHVSMDGPSPNWKFIESLKRYRLENEQSQVIELGSGGLHIIHGAYKTGAESTGWELKEILKREFTLLHDSPARKDDYISLTGYHTHRNTFPLYICATRWIEDAEVADDRIINLWENLTETVRFWEELSKTKQPSCKSFLSVQSAMNDKFVVAKLQLISFCVNSYCLSKS